MSLRITCRIDPTPWASLTARPGPVDAVGAQWVTIDACRQIGSRDDQTLKAFARQHGIEVFPSLLTLSAWLNGRLLNDEGARSTAI